MKPMVVNSEDLYALIGQQHVELILLRKRVIELEAAAPEVTLPEAAPREVSPNGKRQEEAQAEGQAVQG